MDNVQFLTEQLKAHRERRNFAIVTIVKADGSTPRSSGKMLVYDDGTSIGTVGGGVMERMAAADAQKCIAAGENDYREYSLTPEGKGIGMTCGGDMSVYIEVYKNKPRLILCGAGHVGGALIGVARSVGFEVTLVDSRPRELIEDKIALADSYVPVDDFYSGIMALDVAPGAYYVIATFGHAYDKEALAAVLTKDAAYVGMVGSRKKIAGLFKMLREQGASDEALDKVYTPIGLDIGGETPEEISVAVVAEMLKLKYGRTGKHLKTLAAEMQ